MNPRLDLVVGCNGAGKSSLVREVLSRRLPRSPFVNADEIAALVYPDDPEGHSYEAAGRAEAVRDELLVARRSFIAETVFSHPSKLKLLTRAHHSGFRVVLHVVMVPEDTAVQRVARRVAAGGHSVPEDKIRGRYRRLWDNVVIAVGMADQAYVYDNSANHMSLVGEYRSGIPLSPPRWPDWAPDALRSI